MGFFDGTGEALYDAGTGLQRTQAALEGTLGQFDTQQQNIATSKLANFKTIVAELENAALSGDNSPEFLGPRLDKFQKFAKDMKIDIPDSYKQYFLDNPVVLGGQFDKDLLAKLSLQEQQDLKRLYPQSLKGDASGERARNQIKDLVGAGLYRTWNSTFLNLVQEAEANGESVDRPKLMQRAFEQTAPKYAVHGQAIKDVSNLVSQHLAREKENKSNQPHNVEAALIDLQNQEDAGGDPVKIQARRESLVKIQGQLAKTTQTGNQLVQSYFESSDAARPQDLKGDQKKSFNMISSMPPDQRSFLADVMGGDTDFSKKTFAETQAIVTKARKMALEFTGQKSNLVAKEQVVGREQGYQEKMVQHLDRIQREEEAKAGGRPLPDNAQQAVNAMRDTVRVASAIKDEYTPEELNGYVGFFKKKPNEIMQITRADPKFARLNSLVNSVQATAFAEGGKQLTPFEAQITFGHIPTGKEFSTVDFLSKLDTTLNQTELKIRDRYRLAYSPRKAGEPINPAMTPPGTKTPSLVTKPGATDPVDDWVNRTLNKK